MVVVVSNIATAAKGGAGALQLLEKQCLGAGRATRIAKREPPVDPAAVLVLMSSRAFTTLSRDLRICIYHINNYCLFIQA